MSKKQRCLPLKHPTSSICKLMTCSFFPKAIFAHTHTPPSQWTWSNHGYGGSAIRRTIPGKHQRPRGAPTAAAGQWLANGRDMCRGRGRGWPPGNDRGNCCIYKERISFTTKGKNGKRGQQTCFYTALAAAPQQSASDGYCSQYRQRHRMAERTAVALM